ncbi:MAG: hypothetical protein ACK5ME_03050 [Parahaliea sp.]
MSKISVDSQTGEMAAEQQTAFKERMQAQCREIRRYRMQVMKNEHRWLTVEDAASEWIAHHAKAFAEREDS